LQKRLTKYFKYGKLETLTTEYYIKTAEKL